MSGLRRAILLVFAAGGCAGWLWSGDGDWFVGATLGLVILAGVASAVREADRRVNAPDPAAVRDAGPYGGQVSRPRR